MAEDKLSREQIARLVERINEIESLLLQQGARLHAIEQKLDIAPQQNLIAQQAIESLTADHARPAESTAQPASTTPAAQTRETKPRADFESRVGGSWFNRIGMLAIAIGVAFFLKYAFENDLIGTAGLIIIGIAIGVAFLIAGERMRARYPVYAHGLSGGGVLILYISIYAAKEYELLSQPVAFVSMAAVTVIAAFLAARYDALPIAILGLVGGFLTPVLLSTGENNEVALFGYVTLLDAGVLALAYSKQWRSLNYLSFAGTVLISAGWLLAWYSAAALWLTIFFLTLFFAIFALVAVLYNVVNRRPTVWPDLILVFLNAILYFGASYGLLEEAYEPYLGLFAILVAAFYLALGLFAYNRDREDRLLVFTFLGLAILFLVLAVPIQLRQHWVTMVWAIEGAVLVWVGMRARDRTSRYAALGVFAFAAAYWAIIDAPERGHTHGLLLSHRTFSSAILIAALILAASFYKRHAERVSSREQFLFGGAYVLGANALAVALLSIEAYDYFERAALAGHFDAEQLTELNYTRQLTLSALWIVYGTLAMIAGIIQRSRKLRWMSLALLSVTILKVFLLDLSRLKGFYRVISFVALGAILLVVSFLYQRLRQRSAGSDAEAPTGD